jgi:hypothetical protein
VHWLPTHSARTFHATDIHNQHLPFLSSSTTPHCRETLPPSNCSLTRKPTLALRSE